MTDRERLDKNALCDLLAKEGINGRQDKDAIDRTCFLTDLALELERKDLLASVLSWYDALEQKGIRSIVLDFGRANAFAGQRYNTKWEWEQPTLAREIFYLRRAISHQKFARIPDIFKCKCLNNLGNRLEVAGRSIEALDYWRRVLDLQPNFGMALWNRAKVLASYAGGFEDRDVKALVLFAAHSAASAALAPRARYYSLRDERVRGPAKTLKEQIESILDVPGIASEDPLSWQDTTGVHTVHVSEEERDYVDWCLARCLYLNPLNDLGRYGIASEDSIGLGTHVVPVDAPHTFESFYNQMKQEYASARWLLYEALSLKVSHFSDRNVFLGATEPRPCLSLGIEKVKTAYGISYSIFDKVGFFMNAYMTLGIPERQVTFRTLWRTGEKDLIRKEFELTSNWGFCALYWLAKDFFEKANDEVAEPQARGLSEIRNHIAHKYLRVTASEITTVPTDDLALTLSREQLEGKALHLLKLARSALIYLAIGVGFEELRREPSRAGMSFEGIPPTPYLADSEKL